MCSGSQSRTVRQVVPPPNRTPRCAGERLALAEREQKGESNSLGGEVRLDIGRRFTELHMMRKGQVKRLGGTDTVGQAKFVVSLFGIAA